MIKKLSISLAIGLAALTVMRVTHAASFKTGVVVAKTLQDKKLLTTAPGQLYICNNTNLPSQSGAQIKVSFSNTNVPDQTPQPGSCAFLTSDSGSNFTVPVTIFAPANAAAPLSNVNNLNLSSGQMWGLTYDSVKNTYSFAQIQ